MASHGFPPTRSGRCNTLSSKPELRDRALRQRDAIDAGFRSRADAAIARRVAPLLAGLAPSGLAAYVAMRSEVDPTPIVAEARKLGAAIALPAVLPGGGLVFRRYGRDDPLVPGGFGTRVPRSGAPEIVPDVIIVPLVGFDRHGTRIGYGKGHYDRTIGTLRQRGAEPVLIGVAFSAQEVDTIPHEPHDVRLDLIVTEAEILDFRT